MFQFKTNSGYLAENPERLNHDEIRLVNEWDVMYWCLVFQCTREELEELIAQYGNSAAVIRNRVNFLHS